LPQVIADRLASSQVMMIAQLLVKPGNLVLRAHPD
jgi:hypothetical protein